MKFVSIITFLIFNSILWSLINSVKNNKNQNELTRVEETSKYLNKILNDDEESSVNFQNQKNNEKLKPKSKITKNEKTGKNEGEKKLKRKEYYKDYYQKNKERISDNHRNYHNKNKEKINQISKKYYQKNKERISERSREYKKKYQLRMKIEKEAQQNDRSSVRNVFDNNEGNSFINSQNNDCENKGKEAIVSTENVQLDQGNIHPQNDTPSQSTLNGEGISFGNLQTNDYPNNLDDTIYDTSKQEKLQMEINPIQKEDLENLPDLKFLDASNFWDDPNL
ncbi:unnamed protein product [Meloidogyne enterolobii]|uniref:Uncharacterized protein n=1 Tax=Meloidogyne enterolobii TaxID=390850 RepID=A0ACB0Y6Z5_MELEN